MLVHALVWLCVLLSEISDILNMAKLCACYALCPLIDRCPIGVTGDSSSGCVIVTLGKNIVIRYKLADQKQVSSWSCKDKLSAPVIYDHVRKQYIAVFNYSIVRVWDDIEVDLNRVKKHKFDQPIHLVLSCTEDCEAVVIFRNGAVISLSNALQNRKSKNLDLIPTGLNIKDCFYLRYNGTNCVGIHASNDKESSFLIVEVDGSRGPVHSMTLKRQEQKLLGLTIMQNEDAVTLLTLWNDGQLWSLILDSSSLLKNSVGHHLYTITAISSKHHVAMIQISACHVAMYGADPSEEGAMLIIVNTQFRLVQARQHYKLFSDKANLWMIGKCILLVVGHSLAVAPFILDTERLSSLIGSHQPLIHQESIGGEVEQVLGVETLVWEDISKSKQKLKGVLSKTPKANHEKKTNSNSASILLEKLTAQGYSQSMACEILVPSLIYDLNAEALLWVLQNLSDFPESALVRVLTFCLDAPSDTFKPITIYADPEEIEEDSQDGKYSVVDLSIGQCVLLDVAFSLPLSEAVLLPLLRTKLSLPHCLALLKYIAQSLPQTRDLPFSHALLKWGTILLDSHYQQLLLSRDECITTTMMALKELIESQVEYMDDLKALNPMLEKLRIGQSFHNLSSTANFQYCIETLALY